MLKRTLKCLGTRVFSFRRNLQTSAKRKENLEGKMQAWQIHSYGGVDEVNLYNVRVPVISGPDDVLVRVNASSVNPIDVAMTKGYGATVLNLMRKVQSLSGKNMNVSDIEFPLTMGRDFSGTVVSKGHNVRSKLKLGDEVWGVVPLEQPGCHANYVAVNQFLVNPKPKHLSQVEAASMLYAGLTAWSALWFSGGLCYKSAFPMRSRKKVLVLGGSGGVGTLAIQLLRAWNMHVVTTCSSDAVNVLENLGADVVIDYKEPDSDAKIINEGPFEIILDCSNQGPDVVKSKGYPHETYVTLNPPFLKNVDEFGLIGGAVKNVGDLLRQNIPSAGNTSFVKWGFFAPCPSGIQTLQELVENVKLVPVVKKVYPFQELPKAYKRVEEGHLRGKIVVDMNE